MVYDEWFMSYQINHMKLFIPMEQAGGKSDD
jgi:hypothetical protein